MRLIIITKPNLFDGETDIVNKFFAEDSSQSLGEGFRFQVSGFRFQVSSFRFQVSGLHLRKPEATKEQTAKWIEAIEPSYRHRIVLHDHHDLALQYELGGIHLNSRNPDVPDWLDRKQFTLSRSCHSIEEVEKLRDDFDYVFLSPIFDSISKQGYKAAFTLKELAEAKARGILSKNVYALGGVTFENLQEVQELGFYGAALLGGFWTKVK